MSKKQIEQIDGGLRVLAPAKINLSLLIAGKRADGFHEIDTLVSKIAFYDELTIEQGGVEGIEVGCSGKYWAPEGRENLVYTACEKFEEYTGEKLNVKIGLKKNIPAGSGLGSASSDAAMALLALNQLTGGKLDKIELCEIGSSLGSDVNLFLHGPLALCKGRGEKVEEIAENFNFTALLVLPEVNVSTKMVYENYRHEKKVYCKLKSEFERLFFEKRFDLIAKLCANMLSKSCFDLNEELLILKERLEKLTGAGWCLSGSGSGMFSLYTSDEHSLASELRDTIEKEAKLCCVVAENNRW